MKILLIEDDQIVRECVESLAAKSDGALQLLIASGLERDFELAGHMHGIGVVLLGLAPDAAGDDIANVARRFHRAHAQIPFVVLAATEQERVVMQALDAGAMGFINKGVSTRSLLRALRTVLAGGIHVPTSIIKARGMYNAPQNPSRRGNAAHMEISKLADRDAAVARLMLQGMPNAVIAKRLNTSEQAVRKRVSELLKALGVTNRGEAILVVASSLAPARVMASA